MSAMRTRPTRLWAFAGLAPLAILAACGPSVQRGDIKIPEWQAEGQMKCKVAASKAEPLVVEWPSADRAKLEALAKQGLVAVKYSGCEMQVLGACKANGTYRYVGTTLKKDAVRIRDADELYARLPFGAAGLESTLKQSGQLDVTMSIVGRFAADQGIVHEGDLSGSCAGATHVLSALIVGAFEFSAKGASTSAGRGSVFDGTSGASVEAEKQILMRDGDEQRCQGARDQETSPPEGCRALLRVEVTPIAEVEKRSLEARAARDRDFDARKSSAATRRAIGWVTVGVGVAAGITGSVLALKSSSELADIRNGGLATSSDVEAKNASARSLATGAWVAGAIGLVGVGLGITIVTTSKTPTDPAITVGVSPGKATFGVHF